jgi:hypothetical protein
VILASSQSKRGPARRGTLGRQRAGQRAAARPRGRGDAVQARRRRPLRLPPRSTAQRVVGRGCVSGVFVETLLRVRLGCVLVRGHCAAAGME